MNKKYFLCLFLITVMAAGSFILTMAVCNDDAGLDPLFCANNLFRFDELFTHILSQKEAFHGCCHDFVSAQPIISYLARNEKSPPFVPAFF